MKMQYFSQLYAFTYSQDNFFFYIWVSNLYSVLKTYSQVEEMNKECVGER